MNSIEINDSTGAVREEKQRAFGECRGGCAIRMVLFDLDGTLLPMDLDEFIKGYFSLLAKKAMPYGYEPEALVKAVWHGITVMIRNDGSMRNEEAFWKDFTSIYGAQALKDKPMFDEFYAMEFGDAKQFCGYDPMAAEIICWLKARGQRVALVTNPLYPTVATEARVRWAGLAPEDFEFVTTYENIGWCKPNLDYYREVLRWTGLKAEECLMVGNDTGEDMVAAELGMKVFLLTNCLINKSGEDINKYPHGGFEELKKFAETLLNSTSF